MYVEKAAYVLQIVDQPVACLNLSLGHINNIFTTNLLTSCGVVIGTITDYLQPLWALKAHFRANPLCIV